MPRKQTGSSYWNMSLDRLYDARNKAANSGNTSRYAMISEVIAAKEKKAECDKEYNKLKGGSAIPRPIKKKKGHKVQAGMYIPLPPGY
jgi:ureidoglycolate hydrolase